MAVKYSGLLKFADEIKAEINLAADGTVEKAVVIDGDGTETPIGGGDSDFTTAEVSITNNTNDRIIFPVANIEQYGTDKAYLSNAVPLRNGMTKTSNIILYNGCNNVIVNSDIPPSATCSGDITSDGHAFFTIRGNGTITFGTASEG